MHIGALCTAPLTTMLTQSPPALQYRACERPQSMEDVLAELVRIHGGLSAAAAPQLTLPAASRQNLDIPVHFSDEQIVVLSHVVASDHTGSLNLTPSIHSLVLSQNLLASSDRVRRKHETAADVGFAAHADSDRHARFSS